MKHKRLLTLALCWGLLATAGYSGEYIPAETPEDSAPEASLPEGCTVIQRATEGKGIDIVLLGDGFTAKDIADGKWEAAQDSVRKYLFAMEPVKSYKHWFNVYAVTAPYDGPDLSVPIAKGDTVETHMAYYQSFFQPEVLKKDSIFIYAYEHTPVKADKGTPREMLVMMLINSNQPWAGFTTLERFVDRPHWGHALVPFSVFWRTTIGSYTHELLGHGLGDLADEYVSVGMADKRVPDTKMGRSWVLRSQREKHINMNTAFTTNPDDTENMVNRAWAWMIKNNYRGVGTVEGAMHHGKGIWRATKYSIMVGSNAWQNAIYANPVQRELILHKIYKLGGKEEEYNLDVFLEYDKKNEAWDKEINGY